MIKILKRATFTFAIILLHFIYGCKKEENLNRLPDVPKLAEPQNGSVTGPDNVVFAWQCTDNENDDILYTFFISNDSVNWDTKTIFNDTTFMLESLVEGQKYYWKVKAENSFSGIVPEQEQGESVSNVFYFYTTPPGVEALRDSSGHEFINLYWDDPENLDHVEITFEPQVSGITQPLTVNAGAGRMEMTGFENGTIYSFFVKAYDNLNHVSETDTIKAMPLLPIQVHDVDFNVYNIVTIGSQTWLRENLRATRYQDGSPFVNGYGEPFPLSGFIGSESDKYGLYYYSIIASGGYDYDKNPCPCGYHVPTDDEWKTLESYLGMFELDLNSTNFQLFRGELENVGKSLKSVTGWNDYNGENGNGSDIYGFNLLPSGYINAGVEYEMGVTSLIWTSTSYDPLLNIDRVFSNSSNGIKRSQSGSYIKASIRCIKD